MKPNEATSYVEFNGEFINGPIFCGLAQGAQLLWLHIATYAGRNNTGGLMPKNDAHKAVRAGGKHVLDLIAKGLVTEDGDKYRLNHEGKFWRRGGK